MIYVDRQIGVVYIARSSACGYRPRNQKDDWSGEIILNFPSKSLAEGIHKGKFILDFVNPPRFLLIQD